MDDDRKAIEVLDHIMEDLLRNPYCREVLRQRLYPDTVAVREGLHPLQHGTPETIARLWHQHDDVRPIVRGAFERLLDIYPSKRELARYLGISPQTLYTTIKDLGLKDK